MPITKLHATTVAVLLCGALAAGCSGEPSTYSMTGPTPSASAAQPAAAPDGQASPSPAIKPGTGAGTSTLPVAPSDARTWAANHGFSVAADGLLVQGIGVVTGVTGTCPSITIVVRGVPVSVTSSTTFTPPLTCETLTSGAKIKVTGVLTVTPPNFSVTATSLTLADPGSRPQPRPGGKKARGEGVVGAITGTCPELTLVITGTRVATTASTQYVNGSCETLRPGTKVRIDGELYPGGEATAERIEILRVPGRPISGDGVVATVAGSCPTLTMTVRGVAVVTTSETVFFGGTCEQIVPGTHIDVTGEYDGTQVTAQSVTILRLPES